MAPIKSLRPSSSLPRWSPCSVSTPFAGWRYDRTIKMAVSYKDCLRTSILAIEIYLCQFFSRSYCRDGSPVSGASIMIGDAWRNGFTIEIVIIWHPLLGKERPLPYFFIAIHLILYVNLFMILSECMSLLMKFFRSELLWVNIPFLVALFKSWVNSGDFENWIALNYIERMKNGAAIWPPSKARPLIAKFAPEILPENLFGTADSVTCMHRLKNIIFRNSPARRGAFRPIVVRKRGTFYRMFYALK